MQYMSRRRFARLALGGMALAILRGCAPAPSGPAPSIGTQPPTVIPSPTHAARPILRNENRPGFFVRYFQSFEAVDPNRWTLSVEGMVKEPIRLSLPDIQSLPTVSQVSRMKCVECWSAAAKWEGFHLRSLLELAQPSPEAKWLHFECADGYYESLSLSHLLDERVLFAHRMNDQMLPDIYGAPLRLIVPPLYGYKGPKTIVRLVLAEKELVGYWPSVGPYTSEGKILAGQDHPLDLEGTRQIQGGEIIYADGIESSDNSQ
jgi:sulfoxide reductase catalytic subunit YedY